MSIERECFAVEEGLARQAILSTYDKATEEGVQKWLDLWYQNKLPLIEAFGGLYQFGFCKDAPEEEDSEDGELIDANNEQEMKYQFRCHIENWFTPNQSFAMLPFLLIPREKIPIREEWFSEVSNKYDIQEAADAWRIGDVLRTPDEAGPFELLVMKHNLVKPEYYDRVFIKTPSDNSVMGNIVPYDEERIPIQVNFYGVNLYRILSGIIQVTPLEKILENKTNTGMKITKFLKKLYPDDWIAIHYPQEDGRTLSYWENFEKHWSMLLQQFKCRKENKTKEHPDVIVSLSPVDYLMMSEATSWQSCHQFAGNMYSTGGAAYAVDDVTAISFAPREKMRKYNIEFLDKSWRQVVHIDLDNGSAVFGREYPKARADIARASRGAVNYMLAEYHGAERKWWKNSGRGRHYVDSKYVYRDPVSAMTRLKDMEDQEFSGTGGVSKLFCLGCATRAIQPDDRGRRRLTCDLCNRVMATIPGVSQLFELEDVNLQGKLPNIRPISSGNRDYSCMICGETRVASNLFLVPLGALRMEILCVCRYCIKYDSPSQHNLNSVGVYLCRFCNRFHTAGTAELFRERVTCKNCKIRILEEEGYKQCRICQDLFEDIDLLDHHGHTFCETCYEENFSACCRCGETCYNDDLHFVESIGEDLCAECFDELPFCECCDETVSEVTYVEGEDMDICDSCMEHMYECEKCGELKFEQHLYSADSLRDECEYQVCRSCVSDIGEDNDNYLSEQEEDVV